MDKHIQATADALESEAGLPYLEERYRLLAAQVAVRAWLASVGMTSDHLGRVEKVLRVDEWDGPGVDRLTKWAKAARAVERDAGSGVEQAN